MPHEDIGDDSDADGDFRTVITILFNLIISSFNVYEVLEQVSGVFSYYCNNYFLFLYNSKTLLLKQ